MIPRTAMLGVCRRLGARAHPYICGRGAANVFSVNAGLQRSSDLHLKRLRCLSSIESSQTSGHEHGTAWAGSALAVGALGSAAVLAALHSTSRPWTTYCEGQQSPAQEIPKDEVAKHKTRETGIWVTYRDGVYDVTDFVEMHPGGAGRLMLAAGGAIDPFWAMYAQHNTEEVHDILKQYYIGKLIGGAPEVKALDDPYADDPERHPALITRMAKPFNAETPAEVLASTPLTPNDLFYIRNHLPVPRVDSSTWSLRVEGAGIKSIELTLEDLKTMFEARTLPVTLQCSGNRRNEVSAVKHVKGLEWDAGAISTAEFKGVALADVLKYAGLQERAVDEGDVAHVQFEGLDHDIEGTIYGASIPADRAINPRADVLLAWEMNGKELPLDHGYPVRVVVPGATAARSVKWLGRIILSQEESQSHWQQLDYKTFSPSVDWDNVDWASAPAIQDTNVQSAIVEPKPGSIVEGPLDEIPVRGYAFSGGGKGIIRVDLSVDGGKTWTTADLHPLDKNIYRSWAWTLWDAVVPLPANFEGKLEIICKAVDAACNTQPESAAPIWNLRGVVANQWSRSVVSVE